MKFVYDVKYATSEAKSPTKEIAIDAGENAEVLPSVTGETYRRAEVRLTPVYHKEQVYSEELKQSIDVDVDNRAEVTAEIVKSLGKVANYQVKVHTCYHDEPINRPCGGWCVVAEKGKIKESEE